MNNWRSASIQALGSLEAGDGIKSTDIHPAGDYPVFGGNGLRGFTHAYNETEDRLLIGRQGALCGNVHLAPGPLWASEHALVFKPNLELSIKWLKYVLSSLDLGRLSTAAAQPGITASAVGRERTLFPPLATQRRIADYLDHETAEMDSMSEQLDELANVLAERKRRIVRLTFEDDASQSVALAYVVREVSGVGFPPSLQGQQDHAIPFYKVSSLSMLSTSGLVDDPRNTVTEGMASELRAEIVPARSVLLAKIGAAMLLGRFVQNEVPCVIDNNMLALVPRAEALTADYLGYVMQLVSIESLANPGPVPSMNMPALRATRIPLPALDEQQRIVSHLDEEIAKIDAMVAEAQELKDLIHKRRLALITEVVTGRKEV